MGPPIADGHRGQQRVATRLRTPVLSASGGSRPIPGSGGADMLAAKRSFATCGKLTRIFDKSSRSAGSGRVSLHIHAQPLAGTTVFNFSPDPINK